MRRILCLTLALCACISLFACSYTETGMAQSSEISVAQMPTLPPVSTASPEEAPVSVPAWQSDGARNISTWAVYWDDADVLCEIYPYASGLNTLSYFEAFFAADGSFVLPEKIDELYAAVERAYPDNLWDSYLTFVNDLQMENGEIDLKSTDVIAPYLADEGAMDRHIDALIDFTIDKGFDGLEIDYEALRKAPGLWQPFTVFCGRLYERAQEAGLGLRVILEPYAPFDEYIFPNGPTYVIMCYNLHGAHNGPGPKADYEFLSGIIESASRLPGKRIYALATGGYDWNEDGDAVQVTMRQAYELFLKYGKEAPVRYDASSVLYFSYRDEEKRDHDVWCADSTTLKEWSDFLTKAGFGEIAYWRLGGNYLR